MALNPRNSFGAPVKVPKRISSTRRKEAIQKYLKIIIVPASKIRIKI